MLPPSPFFSPKVLPHLATELLSRSNKLHARLI
jgi:hypothetical protein